MPQLWIARELVRLEFNFTNVDINHTYAIHSKSTNKSQLSDAAKENNLSPSQASNNTHSDKVATLVNLYSSLRDSLD